MKKILSKKSYGIANIWKDKQSTFLGMVCLAGLGALVWYQKATLTEAAMLASPVIMFFLYGKQEKQNDNI